MNPWIFLFQPIVLLGAGLQSIEANLGWNVEHQRQVWPKPSSRDPVHEGHYVRIQTPSRPLIGQSGELVTIRDDRAPGSQGRLDDLLHQMGPGRANVQQFRVGGEPVSRIQEGCPDRLCRRRSSRLAYA